jgi:hypothetical protein
MVDVPTVELDVMEDCPASSAQSLERRGGPLLSIGAVAQIPPAVQAEKVEESTNNPDRASANPEGTQLAFSHPGSQRIGE